MRNLRNLISVAVITILLASTSISFAGDGNRGGKGGHSSGGHSYSGGKSGNRGGGKSNRSGNRGHSSSNRGHSRGHSSSNRGHSRGRFSSGWGSGCNHNRPVVVYGRPVGCLYNNCGGGCSGGCNSGSSFDLGWSDGYNSISIGVWD